MTANVKDSCSSEKADEGSNGSGKDTSSADNSAGSGEIAEIQKDESPLKESDNKTNSSDPSEALPQPVEPNYEAKDTGDGSGEDKVVVVEAKEDNSKTSDVKDKPTEEGDAEEQNGVNEAGGEDKISKGDADKKDGDEPEMKDGTSEEKKDVDNKGQSSSPTPLFSFKNLSSGQNAFTGLAGTGFSASSFCLDQPLKKPQAHLYLV
ncbi:hypothetical protein GUJ93_ZPchr0010g7451 [Zizania palustris]|uniref:Uncharacterized protein n=1 Tax=Zizania palustris TaxID=103762 RepID=A0A8J5WBM6_ZIZPA|nr:hypothetical protein GUJ93_ZPchr0010g7451 [Zizania palustris]